jgi:predicted kinase
MAEATLSRTYASYVNKDRISMAFTTDVEGELYKKTVAPAAYRILWDLAQDNLSHGQTVFLESPFNNLLRGERDENLERISRETSSFLKLICCTAPDEIVKARIMQRGEPRDRWKLENWEAYVAKAHGQNIQVPHIKIDTTADMKSNVERVLSYLAE